MCGTNCRWGEWMYSALSTFNTMTEVPLSKAPNPQLLPGHRSINGCPQLWVCVHSVCVFTVCVHFGCVKCRALIPSMGHHTWPYVLSFDQKKQHLWQSCCQISLVISNMKFNLKLSEQFWRIWCFPKQSDRRCTCMAERCFKDGRQVT